jgi:hypothetical protein
LVAGITLTLGDTAATFADKNLANAKTASISELP